MNVNLILQIAKINSHEVLLSLKIPVSEIFWYNFETISIIVTDILIARHIFVQENLVNINKEGGEALLQFSLFRRDSQYRDSIIYIEIPRNETNDKIFNFRQKNKL